MSPEWNSTQLPRKELLGLSAGAIGSVILFFSSIPESLLITFGLAGMLVLLGCTMLLYFKRMANNFDDILNPVSYFGFIIVVVALSGAMKHIGLVLGTIGIISIWVLIFFIFVYGNTKEQSDNKT